MTIQRRMGVQPQVVDEHLSKSRNVGQGKYAIQAL
jgi:hypothetical protein